MLDSRELADLHEHAHRGRRIRAVVKVRGEVEAFAATQKSGKSTVLCHL
jgi:hypothetical protein